MRQILLVMSEENYADEFDTRGFAIVYEDVWNEHLLKIEEIIFKGKEPLSHEEYGAHVVGIGTNEAISFRTFASYKKSFKTEKITEEEAKIFKRIFKDKATLNETIWLPHSYGMFVSMDPDYG